MRVLALDTTTSSGSVAIVEDDRVLVERAGDSRRSHAERLPGDLLDILDATGLAVADLDVFAIASGPGSFTGLRIGIATIQGLAFVEGKRVVPISILEALGEAGSHEAPCRTVGVWMDAHRRDVFSALFRVADVTPFAVDRLIELEPPMVGDPIATRTRWEAARRTPDVVIGDGAVLFAGVIDGWAKVVAPPLLASVIGRMAVVRARAGLTVAPGGIQPIYVRRPDAELARDVTSDQRQPHKG